MPPHTSDLAPTFLALPHGSPTLHPTQSLAFHVQATRLPISCTPVLHFLCQDGSTSMQVRRNEGAGWSPGTVERSRGAMRWMKWLLARAME